MPHFISQSYSYLVILCQISYLDHIPISLYFARFYISIIILSRYTLPDFISQSYSHLVILCQILYLDHNPISLNFARIHILIIFVFCQISYLDHIPISLYFARFYISIIILSLYTLPEFISQLYSYLVILCQISYLDLYFYLVIYTWLAGIPWLLPYQTFHGWTLLASSLVQKPKI